MRRAWLGVVLALGLALVLVTGAQAADANRRTTGLGFGAPVLDVDVAANSGAILIGTDDPGSLAPSPTSLGDDESNLPTWFLYSRAGTLVISGHADFGSAADCLGRLGDTCRTPVRAVALSASGTRFAVAGELADVSGDTHRASLLLGSETAGVVTRVNQPKPILDLDFDLTGAKLAVLFCNEGTGSATNAVVCASAEVAVYTWSGTTLAEIDRWPVTGNPSRLDFSEDGTTVVVGGARHHRMVVDNTAVHANAGLTGNVLAAAVSAVNPHWSVAGYQSGEVAAFVDGSPDVSVLTRSPSSAKVTAVAVADQGSHYAAGGEDGQVHLFRIGGTTALPVPALAESQDTGAGPVRDLRFSSDGKILTAATGNSVAQFLVNGTDLQPLWASGLGAAVAQVSAMADAETVAAAAGSEVAFFDALHSVSAYGPAIGSLVADVPTPLAVTFTNTGNRPENVSIVYEYPGAWDVVAPSQDFLHVPVGEQRAFLLEVTAPEAATPGINAVWVNHTLDHGAFGSTKMELDIPTYERLVVFDQDPVSRAILAGGSVDFPFIVENLGNVAAVPHFSSSISDAAWLVNLPEARNAVGPGAKATFSATVTAPADIEDGTEAMLLIWIGNDTQGAIQYTAAVGARFDVEVFAPVGITVPAGMDSVLPLRIQNRGNVPDNFEVRLVPSALPPGVAIGFANGLALVETGLVEPSDNAFVDVTVRVPSEAEVNITLRLGIQVRSLSDAAQSDSREVLVTLVPEGQAGGIQPSAGGGDNSTPAAPALLLVAALLGLAGMRRQAARPPTH